MDKPTLLLNRLEAIGQSLAQSGHGLALLGLGSVGQERARLDAYSDLDFFAIVEPGTKAQFLDDLSWLSRIQPVAYAFMNTVDGYKLLYTDDIFCEFAVFEPPDMEHIAFAAGRIVWQSPAFDASLAVPQVKSSSKPHTTEWLLGEALTNLYVGLGRFHRGEKLTAQRFIQHYAVDRLLELMEQLEDEQAGFRDAFERERRFEQRFPTMAQHLPAFIQGYAHTPASARAIMMFLDAHFDVNPTIKAAILALC
jgi:hypothetical protein